MLFVNPLSIEIAEIDRALATALEEILQLEKAIHGSSSQHSGWPEIAHPGQLSIHHFTGGHFTEVVAALDHVFGPWVESREACYRIFGYYVDQPRVTAQELHLVASRLASQLAQA